MNTQTHLTEKSLKLTIGALSSLKTGACKAHSSPGAIQQQISLPVSRRHLCTAERDHHARRKKETSLTCNGYVPVAGNPHSRSKQWQDHRSIVDSSEERVSLKSRWRSKYMASKNRGNDAIHSTGDMNNNNNFPPNVSR